MENTVKSWSRWSAHLLLKLLDFTSGAAVQFLLSPNSETDYTACQLKEVKSVSFTTDIHIYIMANYKCLFIVNLIKENSGVAWVLSISRYPNLSASKFTQASMFVVLHVPGMWFKCKHWNRVQASSSTLCHDSTSRRSRVSAMNLTADSEACLRSATTDTKLCFSCFLLWRGNKA